jgi:hypothetical protein
MKPKPMSLGLTLCLVGAAWSVPKASLPAAPSAPQVDEISVAIDDGGHGGGSDKWRLRADGTASHFQTGTASDQAQLPTVTLTAPGSLGLSYAVTAGNSKTEQTPCFWQEDPKANFANEGRNHCAPVCVAEGITYLTKARGARGLMKSTDYSGQVALIADLAREMDTNPAAGTGPDEILTGLLRYAKKRGYAMERLELASWRGVSQSNQKYVIGTKPKLSWMKAAAKDPDVVAIFNFGWYVKGDNGDITRHSGHWVNVVGSGSLATGFDVHNPLLEPKQQKTDTTISLRPVSQGFVMSYGKGKRFNMSGYYQAQGPGLPFNRKYVFAAVLDSVIVFKLKRIDGQV